MQSQFAVIPPSFKSAQEVLSDVRPACQIHQLNIERRMVLY
jgi:hypothetical protein